MLRRKKASTKVVVAVWILFMMGVTKLMASESEMLTSSPESTRAATLIVNCDKDCLQKYFEISCSQYIERIAKYDYKWTNGFLNPKFDYAIDLGGGVARYIGSNLKLQNGFGAWKHVTYSCDLDWNKKAIINYNITDRIYEYLHFLK